MDILLLDGGLPILFPDLGLIFWTTLIFLITWLILGKFAFKPIINALKKREESIDVALKSAEEAELKMKELTAQNDQIIKEARAEKQQILAEAKEQGDKLIAEAKSKAQTEADKIVAVAKEEINSQKQAVMGEVRSQAGALALNIAEKLVKKELEGGKAQDALIASLIDETVLN